MSWQAWAALILLIATVLAVVLWLTSSNKDIRNTSRISAFCLGVLVIIVLLLGCFTIVSTKNVGVVTTFGKPSGTIGNGLNFKAPWQNVTELEGAIQIDNHAGESATPVRLGNDSTAVVENSIRWRIVPDQADQLFLDYREFSLIRENLVTRELNAALNEVFSGFDPLSIEAREEGLLAKLGDDVTTKLRDKVGGQIEILNVIIPIVNYDDETENKINQFNAEVANTRTAEQKESTANAEARANAALSASISNDPNVLVSKCLDIVRASGQSPLGCWPTGVTPTVPVR